MKIVRVKSYRLAMEAMGLTRGEIETISREITDNYDLWPIMPGMYGAQKARFSIQNKGKRDGARAIYYVAIGDLIFFLFAYPKSEQKDLTQAQRNTIVALIKKIKEQK
jgi:hypothetical protein